MSGPKETKERGKSGGKKNPLSNATMFLLFQAAKDIYPQSSVRSPLNWNSLTKGKFSLWLPKDQKIDDTDPFQAKANEKLESKVAVQRDAFPSGSWDPEGTDLNLRAVLAVNVIKCAKRFLRPGEEGEADPDFQEWVFELQIGQPAVEAVQRAEAAKAAKESSSEGGAVVTVRVKDFCSEIDCAGAASTSCGECKSAVCGRCKHSCKKGDGRILNIKPGNRTRISVMTDEIFSVLAMKLSPAELREELEFRLTMFHNESLTEGFVSGSNLKLSPYLSDLQNIL